jgi:hypothetical protein
MGAVTLGSIIFIAMGTVLCQSQVTPVVAKQRTIQDVLDSQGKVVSHKETLAEFLRNSDGSTLTKNYSSAGGKSSIRSGQLADYSLQKVYAINYEKSEAVPIAELHDGPHPEYLANTRTSLGEETINGIRCHIHSVYVTIDGEKHQVGKTYDSAECGLRIKQDAIIEPPGGPRTHLVEQLYDIQIVDPDPKEFKLEKFSFLEKRPAACPKPGAAPSPDPLK